MDEFGFNPVQFAAAFVPDCYSVYRPLVSEGLLFFFNQLREPRRRAIVEEQLALSADTPVPARLVRALHHCPALHKLGQVLARRRELDPTLRSCLQQLETLAPRTPLEALRPKLESELAPAMEPFHIQLAPLALAEGSVAVVVPFSWRQPEDPSSLPHRLGVAKILKPGIVGLLEEDLAILGRLADMLEDKAGQLRLPPLQYREIFDDVRELLAHEVQTAQEQANLAEAGRRLGRGGDVVIPELLPFSTSQVTAMQRIDGVPATDPAFRPGAGGPWHKRWLVDSLRTFCSRGSRRSCSIGTHTMATFWPPLTANWPSWTGASPVICARGSANG